MTNIFVEPTDGWTTVEKLIIRELVISLYRNIQDPLDKFLVMACIQNNFNQEDVSVMVGISQEAISKRINRASDIVRDMMKAGTL